MTKIRPIEKHFYKNYLAKAHEFKNAMNAAGQRSDWNACAGNAVHCAINAIDALTVFKLQKRSAGEKHEDAVSLLLAVSPQDRTLHEKARQLTTILGLKNAAEYGEQLILENEAQTALKQALRILEFVETRIAKEMSAVFK